MRDNDFTKILRWPGYRVYRNEIDKKQKTLRLWVRRKRGNRKLVCSGCGRKTGEGARHQREGSAGSSVHGVPHHGDRGDLPGLLSGLRREDRKRTTVARQGSLQ